MNKKVFLIIAVVVLLGVVGYIIFFKNSVGGTSSSVISKVMASIPKEFPAIDSKKVTNASYDVDGNGYPRIGITWYADQQIIMLYNFFKNYYSATGWEVSQPLNAPGMGGTTLIARKQMGSNANTYEEWNLVLKNDPSTSKLTGKLNYFRTK